MNWEQLADDATIEKTKQALEANGFNVTVVENGEEAKQAALSLIPQNAEVLTMASVTLDTISLSKEINESGKYNSIRNKLNSMNRETQGLEMQKIGSAPEYAIGSVHAITQDGHVVIASRTGSQLPAYASGSAHVIWVVGAQKIVESVEAGIKRIYEHVLSQESARVKVAYGMEHSDVAKILIMNQEFTPNRINIILVKENLGF